jgi:hypothetical protein
MSASFTGHIDPLKISPKGEETKEYESNVADAKFERPGAQAGVLITFTNLGYGDDSATVFPVMETQKTGNLTTPSRTYPLIKNVSLDDMAQSKQIAKTVQAVKAAFSPRGLRRYIALLTRLSDY